MNEVKVLNILTSSEEELRAAFDAVEGAGWFDENMGRPLNEFNIPGNKLHLEGLRSTYEGSGYFDDHDVVGTIYGGGGCNRYFVHFNGDISYSKMHGYYHLERARTAGFAIFE